MRLAPALSCVSIASVLLAGGKIAAAAQPSTLSQSLQRCLQMPEDGARLACYDAVTRPLARSAAASGRAPDQIQAPAVSPSAPPSRAATAPAATDPVREFGLTPLQVEKHDPVPQPKPLQSVAATVTSVSMSAAGRMLVQLDNDQSWELDVADPLLKRGDSVTIKRGVLGAYQLTTGTHRTHQAVRQR